MTAQIGDIYKFEDIKYSIVALNNPIKFDPATYGITPKAPHTACWAGYWCEYDISEDGIVLRDLHINSEDNYYPEINGVQPLIELEEDSFSYFHLYKGINLAMEYTGRIVAGADFLWNYYLHMGYQRAWAYEKLLEFSFEDGKLIETIDHSLMAAKLRTEIDEDPNEFMEKIRGDIFSYVDESFSFDFASKCWWLE